MSFSSISIIQLDNHMSNINVEMPYVFGHLHIFYKSLCFRTYVFVVWEFTSTLFFASTYLLYFLRRRMMWAVTAAMPAVAATAVIFVWTSIMLRTEHMHQLRALYAPSEHMTSNDNLFNHFRVSWCWQSVHKKKHLLHRRYIQQVLRSMTKYFKCALA